jgi:hypothetical protein
VAGPQRCCRFPIEARIARVLDAVGRRLSGTQTASQLCASPHAMVGAAVDNSVGGETLPPAGSATDRGWKRSQWRIQRRLPACPSQASRSHRRPRTKQCDLRGCNANCASAQFRPPGHGWSPLSRGPTNRTRPPRRERWSSCAVIAAPSFMVKSTKPNGAGAKIPAANKLAGLLQRTTSRAALSDASATRPLVQFSQQSFRFLEIVRVEALGEPAVDVGEQPARLVPTPLPVQ